ncbi:MAG: cytochrome c biogenesis protein CcsA [Nitrospirae bacterium]|nr:cytochrome c biogenesis protein CcsA [Nitrospirota bacterium]
MLIHLIIEFKYKNRSLGAFVTPLAALALTFIDVSGTAKEIQRLIPALQSNWLLFHVLLSFLGYAAFGVSFGAAIAYLILVTESRTEKSYIFWSTYLLAWALISSACQQNSEKSLCRAISLKPPSGVHPEAWSQ